MRIGSTRRRLLVSGGLLVVPRLLRAQASPQIRLLVPFAAGGPMDMVARLVAPGAAERLGQTIVVENRTGGTGAVAMAEVTRARPDGTTLMITGSSWPVVMLLNRNLSFRMADFAPLTRMTLAPHLFVVPAALPVRTVDEFVAEARRRPGEWSYGTSGIGTTLHLGTEMLKMRTGIDIVHVPYRGNAPAMADLLAGRLQTMFPTIAEAAPYLADGRLRALAVGYPERINTLPDVPTMAEVGLGDVPAASDFGVATQAEVPAQARARLSEAFRDAIREPGLAARLRELGIFVVATTAERFAEMVREEGERYAEVIRFAKVTLN